jgi:hypothetical protein
MGLNFQGVCICLLYNCICGMSQVKIKYLCVFFKLKGFYWHSLNIQLTRGDLGDSGSGLSTAGLDNRLLISRPAPKLVEIKERSFCSAHIRWLAPEANKLVLKFPKPWQWFRWQTTYECISSPTELKTTFPQQSIGQKNSDHCHAYRIKFCSIKI